MSIRDELARVMYEAPIDGEQGVWPPQHPDDLAYWLSRADAIIARFPYISADLTLYQWYADRLRTKLIQARKEHA